MSINNDEPGYAVLVSGAWGCGKTHIVKQALSQLGDGDALYVSLYGVTSIEGIEQAMARGLFPKTESQAARFGQQAKNLLSGLQVLGTSWNLNQVSLTELALMGLPRVLVFDDLERAEMDLRPLLGVLNRYVEHERKTVVLIAAEDILRESHAEYDREKEKICGRTVNIEADLDAVLPKFLGNCEQEKILRGHQTVIEEVFNASGCQSLRVLNQSLRELDRLLGFLDETLLSQDIGMKQLVQEYLSQSIWYLSGKLSPDEVLHRPGKDRYEDLFSDEKKDDTQWDLLSKSHEFWYDVIGEGAMGRTASYRAIFQGDAGKWINGVLEETPYFIDNAKALKEPAWTTLYRWTTRSEEQIRAAYDEVMEAIEQASLVEPGAIFHSFLALKKLQDKRIVLGNERNLEALAETYIKDRSDNGDICARSLKTGNLGYGGYFAREENEAIVALGYSAEKTEFVQGLYNQLVQAQDVAFERGKDQTTEGALTRLRSDPAAWIADLEGHAEEEHSLHSALIHASPAEVVDALCEAWVEFPKECLSLMASLGTWHHGRVFPDTRELSWLSSFKSYLERASQSGTTVRDAQIRFAITKFIHAVPGSR